MNWTLQEADIYLLGIGVLSQGNQHKRLVGYLRPERERGNLSPYVTNREVNLCDLLQQRNIHFNISAVSEMEHKPTHISVMYIVRYYKNVQQPFMLCKYNE